MIALNPPAALPTPPKGRSRPQKARPRGEASTPLRVVFLDAARTVLGYLELPRGSQLPTPRDRQLIARRAQDFQARSVVLVRWNLEPPFQVRLGELAVFGELVERLHRRGVLFVSLLLVARDGTFLQLHLTEEALLWSPGYAGQWDMTPTATEPA